MLTEKCKKDFEKWYEDYDSIFIKTTIGIINFNIKDVKFFYQLPFSMQYGVYVDFFDSVDIDIEFNRMYDDFMVIINHKTYGKWLKTRPEVRTETVKKANEIYNSK